MYIVNHILLLAQGLGVTAGTGDGIAAGQEEVDFTAALQRGEEKPVPEDMGKLPGVGRGDDDPRALGGHGSVIVLPQQLQQVNGLITDLLGDSVGHIGAVAGGGEIENHSGPSFLTDSV